MKKVSCLLASVALFIIIGCDSTDLMFDGVDERSNSEAYDNPPAVDLPRPCRYAASVDGNLFHFWSCPYADRMKKEDRICFVNPLTAMNSGRRSCTICVDSVIDVYVTIGGEADGIYHTNRNCKHLDHLTEEGKNEITRMVWIWDPGFRRCKDCDEERRQ